MRYYEISEGHDSEQQEIKAKAAALQRLKELNRERVELLAIAVHRELRAIA